MLRHLAHRGVQGQKRPGKASQRRWLSGRAGGQPGEEAGEGSLRTRQLQKQTTRKVRCGKSQGAPGACHPPRAPGFLPCSPVPQQSALCLTWGGGLPPARVGPRTGCAEGPFPQAEAPYTLVPPHPGSTPALTGSEPSAPRQGRFKPTEARKCTGPTGDPELQREAQLLRH